MDKLCLTARERFWNPEAYERDEWVRIQASKIPPGSRVLDAGAGASKYRRFFDHCRYETQDFCQYEGELVKYTQPIEHVCEITRIPIKDGALDGILCTEVFEHVADPMAVLREFGRLLKPGGVLMLTAPQASHVHMEPYHYYGGFSHYWYRHWLPELGFEVRSITPQGGPARVCVCGLHTFYGHWRQWEHRQTFGKRSFSLALRMIAKLPVHYLIPAMLNRFDSRLRTDNVGVGLMVSAVRMAESPRS